MAKPIPVNVSPMPLGLKVGHEFTVAGIKLLPNGRFLTDCKPGDETLLVVSDRASIFKLKAA